MSKLSFFRALSSELDPKGHNYQIQKYGTKMWGIWTVTPSFMSHDVMVQKKLYMTRTDRMTECFLLSTRVDTLLKA